MDYLKLIKILKNKFPDLEINELILILESIKESENIYSIRNIDNKNITWDSNITCINGK